MNTSLPLDLTDATTPPVELPTPVAPPAAREQVIDFLRRELIGPDPVQPYMQSNGEETLVGNPPRLRYGAGVLFPQAALVESAPDVAPGEGVSDDPATTKDGDETEFEGLVSVAVSASGVENFAGESGKTESQSDEVTSLSNAFLPSAMGFSCLVEVPPRGLLCEVQAATYASRDVMVAGKEGKEYPRKHYDRKPFSSTVEIPAEALLGVGVRSEWFDVLRDGSSEKLCVRMLSRPCEDQLNLRLLTIALVNTHVSAGRAENEKCFFQVEMKLRAGDDASVFCEYPDVTLNPDDEERSLSLLYQHRKTYGIGHGCAAQWNETDNEAGQANAIWCDVLPVHEIKPIVPRVFEDLPLLMLNLSDRREESGLDPLLTGLCDRYATWIEEQQQTADALDLDEEEQATAERHLQKCRECLERMRGGVQLLRDDKEVRCAFRMANRAMLQQQLHYALGTDPKMARAWTFSESNTLQVAPVVWPDIENPPAKMGTWYPFQLAFLLMNLRSLSDEQSDERKTVDLIWFPTGGGKTEAYLGLTAFTIVLRRLRHPEDGGTSVLMRYTLRLLTAQQFQRAASLICALEVMRCEGDIPGDKIISIGLWAGTGLTDNKRTDALKSLQNLAAGEVRDNKFIVLNCPYCGAKMGPVEIDGKLRVIGYESDKPAHLSRAQTVVFRCGDGDCAFSGKNILPVVVIDEDLYAFPPTLLLGTVDKFAMMTWQPDARAFFGLKDDDLPPDLIIQDELHLISGPLGSMVGHYETVIEELCVRRDAQGNSVAPKIVASTATISRASEQCHSLWNCGPERVNLFPPQCLRAGDSFFALEDTESAGRKYVGVHASALGSHVTSQVRSMSAMLQAALSAKVSSEGERDPYWTLVGYYNSLRELGHAATLLNADIKEYLNAMWLRKGIQKPPAGAFDERRFIYRDIELTARIPGGRIPERLSQLFLTHPGDASERPVDVALATNMISVGVDVPRLGLMAVAGQPKTTSEYIQATSRVGRRFPGLVVMIYNTGKPRDRSHYEHFHSYHGAVYRAVEPTSVTPFSSPVRDRALHALLTTLVRYRGDAANREKPSPVPDAALFSEIRDIVEARVEGVDEPERDATMKQLDELIAHWKGVAPPRYGGFGSPDSDLPLLYPAGSVPSPAWESKSWPTPTSMRDVDASCEAQVIGYYPQPPVEVKVGETDV